MKTYKKNILIATETLAHGGAERVASLLANQLAEEGHQVYVLTFFRMPDEYFVDDRVHVISFVQTKAEWSKLSLCRQIFLTRDYLKKFHIDVAVSFLNGMQFRVYLASLGLSVRRITTVRNNPWLGYAALSSLYKLLWNLSYNNSDVIQIQCESQRSFFDAENQKKCVVIFNPVNPKSFDYGKRDYSKKIFTGKFIAAARLEPQKNYFMMLQAFAKLHRDFPNVTLDIFGAGGLFQELQNWVTEHGLDNVIRLKGRSENVFNEYLQHDVFLMSSDYEGMPNSLMEAMSVGLACISTDCPTGPGDLIQDGVNGLLVSVGDVDAMYRAMKRVIEEPGLAARLGNEAYKVRERYPVDKIVQQWLEAMGLVESSECEVRNAE